MKVRFHLKDPDALAEGINDAQGDLLRSGIDPESEEGVALIKKIDEMVSQYFEGNEYVTLELDTDTGIMTVEKK